MDAQELVAARLIGTLFVGRGLVSESQIRVALEIQEETDQPLGEILVERFGISRAELARVVAEQWQDNGQPAGPELEAALSANWRRLGEILVSHGFVNREQLDLALARQRQTGERVGEALVSLGVISKFELAGALGEQMSGLEDSADGGEVRQADVVQLPTRDAAAPVDAVADTVPVVETPLEVVLGPSESSELTADVRDAADAEPEPVVLALVAETAAKQSGASPEKVAPARPRPTLGANPAPDEPTPAPADLNVAAALALASTVAGYVLVPLAHEAPPVGETIELDGLGTLVVLGHRRSPLPADPRICVIAEPLSAAPLTYSFGT